jgi:hypothetical protein
MELEAEVVEVENGVQAVVEPEKRASKSSKRSDHDSQLAAELRRVSKQKPMDQEQSVGGQDRPLVEPGCLLSSLRYFEGPA